MPSYSASHKGYGRMWDTAQVQAGERHKTAERFANKALANKATYVEIESATLCPWYMIAAIHMRESSMNFERHLHEGSPLSGRTRLVPKGRPATGSPPFTFAQSAIDALSVGRHNMRAVPKWSTERVLYELEKYNGWGYIGKGNSPYLWAGTNHYNGGKYVKDGVYDPTHVDTQLGCVALLKVLADKDPSVKTRLEAVREDAPPKDVVNDEKKRATKSGKVIAGAGGGVGGVSGTTEATVETSGLTQTYTHIGIGLGLAILTAGIVIWVRSHFKAEKDITERW